jgi:hypothetical protein
MVRLRHVALLTAIGCSPVKDASNVPDASIDAMDTRAPMVASSNPGDKATKVSILQPISVFLDEALDPASVSEMTVRLGYDASLVPLVYVTFNAAPQSGPLPARLQPVRGMVSYDADAKKISFVPVAPLQYGQVYTLSIDVKDQAGLALTTKLTFTTFTNLNTRQYSFNTSTLLPFSWQAWTPDMNGRMTKRVSSNGSPGADQTWFTPDDPRSQPFHFKFTGDGKIEEERPMSPGPDGQYDTADDVPSVCVKYSYNAEGQLANRVFSSQIGPDATWCTMDDVPSLLSQFEYADGAQIGWVHVTPGADNIWRNADDRCSQFWDFVYDERGNKTREILRNCGSDQMQRTADDTFSQWYEYEYDMNNLLVKQTWRTTAGTDGMWLTNDDGISSMLRWVRTPEGLVTDHFTSNGAGTDAIWGTPDDAGSRTSNKYDAKKLLEETTFYSAQGVDAMWGTTDDVISSYHKLTYNAVGNRTDLKQYAIGPDNMWRTADDRVSLDYEFDLKE